jgi:hypothetical protein
VLQERFPRADVGIYDQVRSECLADPSIASELITKLGTDNVEPIGYICIDRLRAMMLEEVQNDRYTKHHPFD